MTRASPPGGYDWYINAWAQDFKSLPYTVVLRLDWEENGWWYGWATGGSAPANTHASYVAMWRHVHDVFEPPRVS
jgi:mannan endo-1,4-beta-mannosidase